MINTLSDTIMSQTVMPTSQRGDAAAYRQLVDAASKELPTALNLMLLSTVPRGGLQPMQPVKLNDLFVKAYVREWQAEDDASWKAIATGRTVKAVGTSRYVDAFLKPAGIAYAASAPVRDPVFAGYPGVLQAHRTADAGPFTEAELAKLTAAAVKLGDQLADVRAARAGTVAKSDRVTAGWGHVARPGYSPSMPTGPSCSTRRRSTPSTTGSATKC